MPHLPAPGASLRQVYLSHLAVAGDEPGLFHALMDAALDSAKRRGFALALTGLAARHPLAAIMRRRYRAREYRTMLHLVRWDHGSPADMPMSRLPHVEIAVL